MTETEKFTGTPRQNLRATRILFIGMVAGIVIFSLLSILVNRLNGPMLAQKTIDSDVFLWAAVIVASLGLIGAKYFYNKAIQPSRNSQSTLNDRLNQYRATLILYMVFCEVPTLLAVIFFFLTGRFILLGIAAISLIAILVKATLIKKVIIELGLDWKEQQEIE